ncbi:MAG: ribosome assembly RNA-binding protein YhbY [Gemmatimonadota bacterium]|nr:ribosome assembly RNA-binding protein YhbY [Gemmatimonadota bacterium]
MTELTGRQRSHLRSLAHHLDPVVTVGRDGLSDPVMEEVDDVLRARELIKVKLPGDRKEREAIAEELARRSGAALAGTIGRIAILYRPHPEPEKRAIELPRQEGG